MEPDVLTRAWNQADAMRQRGMPQRKIEQALLDQGFDAHMAKTVVTALFEQKNTTPGAGFTTHDREVIRRKGQTQMFIGTLIFLAGMFITLASFSVANRQGGYFVFAYGAIATGLGNFILGLVNYIRSGKK